MAADPDYQAWRERVGVGPQLLEFAFGVCAGPCGLRACVLSPCLGGHGTLEGVARPARWPGGSARARPRGRRG